MKKMHRLLLMLLALMLLCCTAALAETASEKEMDKLYQMIDQANEKIEGYIEHAQATEKNDIDWLQRKVDKVVTDVKEYGEKIGVTVECEMVDYEIDGQIVSIDPLKVINSDKDNENKE